MVLNIDDWIFDVDFAKTMEHTSLLSADHCVCGYCVNYYLAIRELYPALCSFLGQFGLDLEGPVELMPIEPTLYLATYPVQGRVLRLGSAPMMVDGIPITVEVDGNAFRLEVGYLSLPWLLDEPMDEVVSPANEPEFLEKMYRKVLERTSGNTAILS
jgi:hypothetical protein